MKYHIIHVDSNISADIHRHSVYYDGVSECGTDVWSTLASEDDIIHYMLIAEDAIDEAEIICLTLAGHYAKLVDLQRMSLILRQELLEFKYGSV